MKENNYNIKKAKNYLIKLYKNDLMFHFDDGAVDCLYKNGVCSLEDAQIIDRNLDQIYESNLNWGKFICPIGYSIYLEKLEDKLGMKLTKELINKLIKRK
jgi:hypothetical protein